MKGALVIRCENPFDPASRRVELVRRRARVRSLAPRRPGPVIAILNGRPLLRAGWRRRLRQGDVLLFCRLPRGGGGNGGSNPLRTVLLLALAAFATPLAGWMLGASAGSVLFGTFTLGKALALGIMLGGSALINTLLPMPTPSGLPTPSPTYTIGAQGNTARLEQAIPVQYGRLLVWPDWAAQPYFEFAGNEQYLYQLLVVGAGAYDVEDIRIEDTPVAAFSEIETQLVAPGEQVTLFPTQVVTSVEVSGQTLAGAKAGTYSRAGTTITVTETDHGRAVGQTLRLVPSSGALAAETAEIATVVDEDQYTLTSAASGSTSGSLSLKSVLGGIDGFTASAAESEAQRLALDLVLPRGLFGGGSSLSTKSLSVTFRARRVDADGAPLDDWIALATETISDRTVTPIRRSFSYDLDTPGRYRVQAWREDVESTDSDDGHEVMLAGLRAYLADAQDWGDLTLLAIRARATNNLSAQSSRRFGVVCTRKLPIWDGEAWSAPTATRSLAWAIADAARDTAYGAGLPDSRIDLDALLALDALWEARGDRFDGRFDSAASWWEAVSRIAFAGRARLYMQGGRLRVVRDGGGQLPVALFSMRNIRRGSFGIDYLMPVETSPGAVEVSYFDEVSWQPRRVTASLPGATGRPAKLELFGATSRAQALREGLYHAAASRYRRRSVRFSTEMEGFIPTIGDLVAIQHDTPAWGQQAEVLAWDAGTLTLTLSEPVSIGEGAHYLALRRPDGGVDGPYLAIAGATDREVALFEPPDFTPETGSERERSHAVVGPGTTWATLAKVVGVRPKGLYEVEIEAIPDHPAVHAADSGAIVPTSPASLLPLRPTRPVVKVLIARKFPDDATRALLSWTPAPGAESYQIEMAEGSDPDDPEVSWTRVADTTATHLVATMMFATRTLIRVRGVGLAAGPWRGAAIGSLITEMWGTSGTPMWTSDSNLMWSS